MKQTTIFPMFCPVCGGRRAEDTPECIICGYDFEVLSTKDLLTLRFEEMTDIDLLPTIKYMIGVLGGLQRDVAAATGMTKGYVTQVVQNNRSNLNIDDALVSQFRLHIAVHDKKHIATEQVPVGRPTYRVSSLAAERNHGMKGPAFNSTWGRGQVDNSSGAGRTPVHSTITQSCQTLETPQVVSVLPLGQVQARFARPGLHFEVAGSPANVIEFLNLVSTWDAGKNVETHDMPSIVVAKR